MQKCSIIFLIFWVLILLYGIIRREYMSYFLLGKSLLKYMIPWIVHNSKWIRVLMIMDNLYSHVTHFRYIYMRSKYSLDVSKYTIGCFGTGIEKTAVDSCWFGRANTCAPAPAYIAAGQCTQTANSPTAPNQVWSNLLWY